MSHRSTGQCVTPSPLLSTLLGLPANHSIPAALAPRANREGVDDVSIAAEWLRGTCLILLGDSTTSEVAHDLVLLLHRLRLDPTAAGKYEELATRMPHQRARLDSFHAHHSFAPGAARPNVTFARTQRRMWVHLAEWDAVIYMRSNAHTQPDGNLMGIRSLNDEGARREIRYDAETLCGGRRRAVWLQSGYHDVNDTRIGVLKVVNLSSKFKATFNSAVDFATSLGTSAQAGPSAGLPNLWLSRHSVCDMYENTFAMSSFEEWVRAEMATPKRHGWSYTDYRDAWACTVTSYDTPVGPGLQLGDVTVRSLHLGTIEKHYVNESFCCPYLSPLRTWLALMRMAQSQRGAPVRTIAHGHAPHNGTKDRQVGGPRAPHNATTK